MSDTIEVKNKEIIYNLVEKYFDFTKESLELFKLRLFTEPLINKEYKEILGKDSENGRKYYELTDEYFEELDEGWENFKYAFGSFVTENGITYSQFRKNNFNINGQVMKAGKALSKYYLDTNNPKRLLFNFCNTFDSEIIDIIFSGHPLKRKNVTFIRSVADCENDDSKIHVSYRDNSSNTIRSMNVTISEKAVERGFTNLKPIFTNFVNERLDIIGTKKMPNKKLYLTFSLNFADWFLCSTAEKWKSCLNLESDC